MATTDLVNYENFTPDELRNYIEQDIQRRFDIKDTNLVTTGPLSILANTIANVLYDAKQYYHYITRELNVATAENFNSMIFHASIYNYNVQLAIPASAEGLLMIPKPSINENQLWKSRIKKYQPLEINNVAFRVKDEIIIEYQKKPLNSDPNTFVDDIKVIYQGEGVPKTLNAQIAPGPDGKEYIYVKLTADILEQVRRDIQKFIVPKYSVGENIDFDVFFQENEKIYKLKIYVNDYDNPEIDTTLLYDIPIDSILNQFGQLVEYEPKLFKFNSTPYDQAVFVQYQDKYQGLKITIGNGIYGKKLNFNDELIVIAEVSKGANGNIAEGQGQLANALCNIIDTNINNTIATYTSSFQFILTSPARGGKDADDIETMRFNILKKFTERNSLITPLDYAKYYGDKDRLATAISKQLNIGHNRVIVYKEFRRPYDNAIVDTRTNHIRFSDYNMQLVAEEYLIAPDDTFVIGFYSPFVYLKEDKVVYSYYLKKRVPIPLSLISITREYQITPIVDLRWDDVRKKPFFAIKILKIGVSPNERELKYEIRTNTIGTYVVDDLNNDDDLYRSSHNLQPTDPIKFDDEEYHVKYIDSIYLDKQHFITSDIIFDEIRIVDKHDPNITSDDEIIHRYSVPGAVRQMIFVQTHEIYYDRETHLLEGGSIADHTYVLYCPFINKQQFEDMLSERSDYEEYFINYFRVQSSIDNGLIPYNIQVNQTFPDTININPILQNDENYVIENENSSLQANYDIHIQIRYNSNQLSIKGLSISDLEVTIQFAVTSYLFQNEGIDVKVYRTDLIKIIEDLFPDIINDVVIISPKTLVVETFDKFLNKLTYADAQVTDKDILFLHPTYFHFGYNNMRIEFIEERQQN